MEYEWWWSGNQDGDGGVGVLVKAEQHDKVVEVRRVNYRVVSLAIVFEEEVVRVICSCAPKVESRRDEKNCV